MTVTRTQLLMALAITSFYLVGQLLTGTDILVSVLFAVAILFGTLSVSAGGGLASAFGFLNAILIGKFLLLGVAVKILLFEPADRPLNAPHATAFVMALGFWGLFLGTTLQSRLSCPQYLSMNRPFGDRMLLSFAVVLFVFSYLGYFAGMIPSAQGNGLQTGGWLGIARAMGSLKSFAIVPPMLYLWRTNAQRWMTHPVILVILAWSALTGIFSTNKQDAIEPLVFYVFVGFLRYGWRNLRLWSLAVIGLAYFAMIVFPYSQYVRNAGGREGSFAHRLEVTKLAFWRTASDESFRSTVNDRVTKDSYFERGPLSPFGRFAMVGEADKLISATDRQQAFTGWETIIWGFKLVVPSFLSPNKPTSEAGNYLAHIVGEVGSADTTTQVSYGVMANLYNAFSLAGVIVGTPIFFAGFYYWIRIFLGQPKWDGIPTTSTLWFIWLIASYQHSIVESSFSGIVASLAFPVILAFFCIIAAGLCLFFPRVGASHEGILGDNFEGADPTIVGTYMSDVVPR